jgi:hypothetical protein
MNNEEYSRHVGQFTAEMQVVTVSKNLDYSAGSDDTLSSFYRVAEAAGVTPVQAWLVFLMKHVCAVERYVKTGQLCSESIHSRLIDLANYAMLGDALVEDLTRRKNDAKG